MSLRRVTLAALLSILGGVLAVPTLAAPAAAVGEQVIAWVEVEDGTISGGPVFNSGDHSNFSGTGSYTFRETGMTSEMSVTAPEAGVYPVYVRYAAGPLSAEENVTRSMGLLTNGGDRQQMSLPMTSFGDWETWRFVKYEVTLDQGANTVAIQCDRSIDFCRLNFDAIQVGGTAPDPCAATAADPGYTSLFDGTFASFDGWRKAGLGGFGRQTDCTIRTVRGRGAEWFTQQQAAPYTLRLDWRQQAANDDSSVHLASTSRGGADPAGGVSVRIGADTGAVVPAGGALQPADATAVASALRPAGEWNSYAIQVTGSQVRVYLNDTLVNTYDSPTTLPANGFIGLENRSSTDEVDFKRIEVKPGVEPDLDSTTSLSVAPSSVTVKRGTASASVTVTADGATPTGQVAVYVDGAKQATATLVDGKATATLGPFGTTGARTVEARYLGSGITKPSTSPVSTLVVKKATPSVRLSVRPRRIEARETRARLGIVVSAWGFTPTGKVTVRLLGKSVGRMIDKTSYAANLRGGRATITLPRFKRSGTVRAVVTYRGDARAQAASTSRWITVRR